MLCRGSSSQPRQKNFAAMLDRQADAHPNRIAFLTPSGPDDEPIPGFR
ncbi:long-chain-fatty-acid-CoA ligase [Cutibacterium acnes JCM 18918]|nr:long-chain-fatty-acid-CoA ligase [Cutibacterium acnes JCM 18918]